MSIHGRARHYHRHSSAKSRSASIQGEIPPHITGARTSGIWWDCLSLVPSDRQRSHEPVEDTTHFFHFFVCVLSL